MSDFQESKKVFECPKFWVLEHKLTVQNPDGNKSSKSFWTLCASPWTRVVAFDDQDRILLIQEKQPSENGWLWRLPGGRIESGEEPSLAALRELSEETGINLGEVTLLFIERSTASWYKQIGYVYASRVKSCENTGSMNLEPDEMIRVRAVSINEAKKMANDNLFDAWTEKSLWHAISWRVGQGDKESNV